MDNLDNKLYYCCNTCNVVLRKSNKWMHEQSKRHNTVLEVLNIKELNRSKRILDIVTASIDRDQLNHKNELKTDSKHALIYR